MRVFFAVLGIMSFLAGGAAYYLSSQNHDQDPTENAIRQALKLQIQAASSEVSNELVESRKQVESALAAAVEENKLKNKNVLESPKSPTFLMLKNESGIKEYKAKKDIFTEDIRQRMYQAFQQPESLHLWMDSARTNYILLRGKWKSATYIALYREANLFGALRSQGAIRHWLALENGTILFHGVHRFVGANATSIRPVAQGIENLRRQESTEMQAKYVGLEGKEILGAWTTLPEWGLVIGSEWPSLKANKQSTSWFHAIALIGFIIGAFLLGLSAKPRPIQVTAAQREMKDMSHEVRAFVKKAERQAENALEFARKRDEECTELEARAREHLAYAERTRWIFEKTEAFLEEAVDAKEEHLVWQILADYLSKMALQAPVLVFTYSGSSCSLIPQASAGTDFFSDSAKRYIQDSRILVGDIQQLPRIVEGQAYEQWRERWERFMPLSEYRFFSLPFASPTGSRGVLFFLFTEMQMTIEEVEKQRELWSLFAYRAAWLYDMKRRLLQSKHGNKRTDKLAGPTDRTRDQLKTS